MNALLLVSALFLAEPAAHDHQHQLEKLGKVNFQTSCSPQAHATFTARPDLAPLVRICAGREQRSTRLRPPIPTCSIAHWGAAMSLYHPLWAPPSKAELERAHAALAKAEATPAKSDRERDYVAAVATFYRDSDKLDHKTRALAYNAAMAALHKRYPADREAAIFYALSQVAAGTTDNDPNFAREKEAAAILNAVAQGGARSSRRCALSDPRLRLSAARRTGGSGRPEIREHRAGLSARAAHAVAHLHEAGDVGGFDRIEPEVGSSGTGAGEDRKGFDGASRTSSCTRWTISLTPICRRGRRRRPSGCSPTSTRCRRSISRSSPSLMRRRPCRSASRWRIGAGKRLRR